MERAEALQRVAKAPSGHLATIRPDGRPHIVVVTHALVEQRFVVTAIDHKPKSTHRLQRISNVEANPSTSFLVDHYENDWRQLWWVRVDGDATVIEDGPERKAGIDRLVSKYAQYRESRPTGPIIRLEIESITGWSSTL